MRKIVFGALAFTLATSPGICTPSNGIGHHQKENISCSCTDLTRESPSHNTLIFTPENGKACKDYEDSLALSPEASGQGTCVIGNAPYPCSYTFGKIHPTQCTETKGQ